MIKSILLATDGSNHAWAAWKYTMELAVPFDAWVRVISVVDSRVRDPGALIPVGALVTDRSTPVLESEHTPHRRLLDEVQSRSRAAGIQVQTLLAGGVPSEAILAQEPVVDMVIIGHRARSPFDTTHLMGSVAEAIVRKSSKPVLVCPDEHVKIHRILAAYDGSDPAKRALHWSANLAHTLKIPVEVLHVGRSDEWAKTLLREASEYLRPYLKLRAPTMHRQGDVVEEILNTAAIRGSGLIVMGAHGHRGLREMLLGSVTEGVLHKLVQPVLMVR